MRDADFLGNLIGGLEADAVDIAGEAIGIFANGFDGVLAVGFVDANGAAGADAVRVQENHDIANDFLLGPGIFDELAPHRADALNVLEAAGFRFDDVENLLAEFGDEFFGVDGADAFDHTAAEIFLDTFAGGGGRAAEEMGFELKTELAIADPAAFGGEPFAGADGGQGTDDGNFIPVVFRFYFKDGESVLFVEERDSFNQPR